MVFRVKVEEYSELLLEGSEGLGDNLHVWLSGLHEGEIEPRDCSDSPNETASSRAVTSCPQVYTNKNRVVRLVNVVVNLRNGNISSFAWDNGCAGCGPQDCMKSSKTLDLATGATGGGEFDQGTCGQSFSTCTSNCALKVFLTWAGTDKNGRHAASAGIRLARFTGHTLKSLYETMQNSYRNVASKW